MRDGLLGSRAPSGHTGHRALLSVRPAWSASISLSERGLSRRVTTSAAPAATRATTPTTSATIDSVWVPSSSSAELSNRRAPDQGNWRCRAVAVPVALPATDGEELRVVHGKPRLAWSRSSRASEGRRGCCSRPPGNGRCHRGPEADLIHPAGPTLEQVARLVHGNELRGIQIASRIPTTSPACAAAPSRFADPALPIRSSTSRKRSGPAGNGTSNSVRHRSKPSSVRSSKLLSLSAFSRWRTLRLIRSDT